MNPQDLVINLQHHEKRKAECEQLFNKISIEGGQAYLSIGCGTSPEFSILKSKFHRLVGVDHSITQTELARSLNETENAVYFTKVIGVFLEDQPPMSFEMIGALDIDSNIFVTEIADQCRRVLRNGGLLLFTERKANYRIYGRYFIEPFLDELRQRFAQHYDIRFYDDMSPNMDCKMLVLRKI